MFNWVWTLDIDIRVKAWFWHADNIDLWGCYMVLNRFEKGRKGKVNISSCYHHILNEFYLEKN